MWLIRDLETDHSRRSNIIRNKARRSPLIVHAICGEATRLVQHVNGSTRSGERTARAPLQQQQGTALEASGAQLAHEELEWYYTLARDAKDKVGLVTVARLRVQLATGELPCDARSWAQGMDGWRPLRLTAQLK